MLDKLLSAIKDSYAQRFFVATVLTVAVAYLWVTNQAVPTELYTVWLFVLGYGTGILNEKALKTPVQKHTDSDADLL